MKDSNLVKSSVVHYLGPKSYVWLALRRAGRVVRRLRWFFAGAGVLLLLAIAWVFPHDAHWSPLLKGGEGTAWMALARVFRRWGDFTDTVVFCGLVCLAGALLRRRRFRLLAMTCFIAASLSGLTANVFRFSVGRARPPQHEPYHFVGPTFKNRYQSFPSGHCSTSVANGVAMFVASPVLGFPVLVSAAIIVWSSLYTHVHYASDVVAGSSLGLLYGLAFGLGFRRFGRPSGSRDAPGSSPPENT